MSDVNVNHLIHLSLVKIAKNLQSRKGCELRRTLLLSSILDRARYCATTPCSESDEMIIGNDDNKNSCQNAIVAHANDYDESQNDAVCQQSQQGMEDLSTVSMDCESVADDSKLILEKDSQRSDDIHHNDANPSHQPKLRDDDHCNGQKRKLLIVNKDQVVPGDSVEITELEYYREEDEKDENSLMDLCSPTKRIKVF
ncbi:hypothetical protein TrispH2_002657 [Trichoplax sp. H2]|uniref:Uncharacterized protein n=1 Tax=Trichoplax adhaerens TaxID=10228 RepID=B3RPB9_TRIAD|nr:predicted protein [Trichoplax adhaerens]XP_002118610.1 predicted protein [Trichoplax adhaerens]EDV18904.1 predicted protein [Trichoplax adhaerens]EDV28161.1 predicted protein [Trichoplax adhaerens]RDD45374.1 hypothetical protein TrispH2_002657 [Trichoplax sp. H2]|eukprot:XP_002109995.1 predicted protein [Trichoplax adhaerens]